jgi:hypothetical protein
MRPAKDEKNKETSFRKVAGYPPREAFLPFQSGTRGFSAAEDKHVAVCLLPGTELSFTEEARRVRVWPWSKGVINHKTAIFRQVNQDKKGGPSRRAGISGRAACAVDIARRRAAGDGSSTASGGRFH